MKPFCGSRAAASFQGRAENVVLIGELGTWKRHISAAFGILAVEHHRKCVGFFSTVELVNMLDQESTRGKPGKIAEALMKTERVILDEPGHLRFQRLGRCAAVPPS